MKNNIVEVIRSQARDIIEARKPIGSFYEVGIDKYIGIDNNSGDAYVEEFDYKEDCFRWLNGEELDDILITDDDTNEIKIEKLKKFYNSRKMTRDEIKNYLLLTLDDKISEELEKQNNNINKLSFDEISNGLSNYLKETNKERMFEGWPENLLMTIEIKK